MRFEFFLVLMEINKNIETILILGLTGHGKSTLSNCFFGKNVFGINKEYLVNTIISTDYMLKIYDLNILNDENQYFNNVKEIVLNPNIKNVIFVKKNHISIDNSENIFFVKCLKMIKTQSLYLVTTFNDLLESEDHEKFTKSYFKYLNIILNNKVKIFKGFISFNINKPSDSLQKLLYLMLKENSPQIKITNQQLAKFLQDGKYLGEVIVTGLPGHGKTTLINTIYSNQLIRNMKEENSQNIRIIEDYFQNTNHRLKSFEIPGFGDIDFNEDQIINLWKTRVEKREIAYILLVFKIDENRLSTEFFKLLKLIKNCLIKNLSSLSDSLILICTNCDKLENPSLAESNAKIVLNNINKELELQIKNFILFTEKCPNESTNKLLKFLINNNNPLIFTDDLIIIKALKMLNYK